MFILMKRFGICNNRLDFSFHIAKEDDILADGRWQHNQEDTHSLI